MLITIALLLQKPGDGLQRFQDFLAKNKSFSVQLSATSGQVRVPGKGYFILRQPDSFRGTMQWGVGDYTYVKNPSGSVDFAKISETYQEYGPGPGLELVESALSPVQAESLPLPILLGDLKRMTRAPFKMTSQQASAETYTATWSNPDGSGKVVAVIGADGRLMEFDFSSKSAQGVIDRTMTFSNYVLNPSLPPDTFSTTPPLGFSCYEFVYPDATVNIGESFKFGKWKSARGSVDVDAAAKGKLVIVRSPNSPPADALIKFLGTKKLGVGTVVVSLGASGGSYWAPSAAVAKKLSTVGTPLMILMGSDGKIKNLWMGFDKDDAGNLAAEIARAAKKGGA